MPAFGGTDMETLDEALRRGATQLGSKNRLISTMDYEREVLNFSNCISQAKATVSNATSSTVKVDMPTTFANDEIHIICEVHDQSKYALPAYRRVIIKPTE